MDSEILPDPSPDEQELAHKRAELAVLQTELADGELYLTNLRVELAAFEGRYLREVGVLYAQLDDWEAKIAELVARIDGREESRIAAIKARAQAKESYSAAHGDAAKAAESSLPGN